MRVEIPNTITATIGGLISRGVKAVEVTDGGRLVFTLTDGSTVDVGSVVGPQGEKGSTGRAGAQEGRYRARNAQKARRCTGAKSETRARPKGETGAQGEKGDTGAQGSEGRTGAQGQRATLANAAEGETGAQGRRARLARAFS